MKYSRPVLYRPDWHEPLTDRAWDAAWVTDAVAAVVDDAVRAWDDDDFWPAQEWDAWGTTLPLTDLYCGAAGVVWALSRLGADFDGAAAAVRVHEHYRAAPKLLQGAPPLGRAALFSGETGIACVRYLLAPSDDVRDLLIGLIRTNLESDANELMWGVPGTLLVARAIGAEEAARASEEALRAARDDDGLWTQHLYGQTFRSLGPIHGLTGNAFALGDLESTHEILRKAAVRDDGHVEERVAGPVVAVRLRVDDVAQLPAAPRDLGLELQRVARLVRAVDHDDAVGRRHEAVVAAADFRFDEQIAGELLHRYASEKEPADSRSPVL